MAIIVIEVKDSKKKKVEITCDLYRKGERVPISLTQILPSRKPKAFLFEDLEPATEYLAVFHGVNIVHARNAFALFRTKPDPSEMKTFNIIAQSCDRPDRMLLGQKNPWYDL